MADVIPLAPRRRFRRAAEGSISAQDAEILFFTGVRYERQPEPAQRRSAPAERRAQPKPAGAKPAGAKRARRKA